MRPAAGRLGGLTPTFRRALIAAALAAAACSGSPTGPVGVTPTPSVSPSPSPSPSASPTPSAASCALGKGDVDARCARAAPRLLPDVEAAIDRVVRAHPQLFDTREELAPGAYRVLRAPDYLEAVARELAAAGFCAQPLGDQLQVKNTQDFSEEYDIITANGFIRRGAGSYVKFCSPASFPLTVEDVLKSVHVLPVSLLCAEAREPLPALDRRQIPLGCTMVITATPKDKNLDDVDPRLHGPDIKWDVPVGESRIRVEEFPGVPFNKKVVGLEPGAFGICAEVQKVVGCLNGTVSP